MPTQRQKETFVTFTTRNSLTLLLAASILACTGCDDKAPASDPAKTVSSGATKTVAMPEKKPEAAGAKIASCNMIKAEGLCRQYGDANISAAGMDFIKGLCTGGEFKQEACPKDKRVGSCATPEGTKVFYNDGPFPLAADKAEKQCKEGVPAGQWKAGE